MLSDAEKERLRTLTVEVLLAIRAEYLRTPGVNVLKHWEMLTTRMRGAARTTATPEEWATTLARKLLIPVLSSSASSSVVDLVHFVTEHRCAPEFLDLIDREHGYLIAMARLISEKRREAREGAGENGNIAL